MNDYINDKFNAGLITDSWGKVFNDINALTTYIKDERWITINNAEGRKGNKVKISASGEILAGMGGKFNGQKIDKMGEKEPDKNESSSKTSNAGVKTSGKKYKSLGHSEVLSSLSNKFKSAQVKSTLPEEQTTKIFNVINKLTDEYTLQNGDDSLKQINFGSTMYHTASGKKKNFGKDVGGVIVTMGDGSQAISINGRYNKNDQVASDFYELGHSPRIDSDKLGEYVTTHEVGHLIYSPGRGGVNKQLDADMTHFFNSGEFREHSKLAEQYEALEDTPEYKAVISGLMSDYNKGTLTAAQANKKMRDHSSKIQTDFMNNNPNFLGLYATTNKAEFVAEAFAEYKLSSTPGKFSNIIGGIIDKHSKR
tara:strand:+ start:11943 stop:13040 length:1098 start_codon:yes stop_codon:yes gene_type:complete